MPHADVYKRQTVAIYMHQKDKLSWAEMKSCMIADKLIRMGLICIRLGSKTNRGVGGQLRRDA